MRRLIRLSVVIGLAALLVFLAVAILAAVFIKPDSYKPRIEAAVLDATGKTLNLNGDISLSLFPVLRLQAEGAELHDAAEYGMDPFLSVRHIKASVSLLPLLVGRVTISKLLLQDLSLKLAVNQKGVPNWRTARAEQEAPGAQDATAADRSARSDGGQGGGPDGGPDTGQNDGVTATSLRGAGTTDTPRVLDRLHIESLRLENARISYHDFGSGAMFTVTVKEGELDSLAPGSKATLALSGDMRDKTSSGTAAFTLNASVTLPSAPGQSIPFTFSGSLDTDNVTGEGVLTPPALDGGRPLELTGKFAAARLDLDRYLSAAGDQRGNAPQGRAPVRSRAEEREAENASRAKARSVSRAVNSVSLDIAFTADTLVVKQLPLAGITASLKAGQGEAALDLTIQDLAGGSFEGAATVTATDDTVRIASTGLLERADLDRILLAATGKTPASGKLDLSWNVTGEGVDWSLLAPSLAGKAAAELTDGLIPGFELIPAGIQGIPSRRMDIGIQHFSASWDIANGIASSRDLLLQSPGISATGSGRFMLAEKRLDYTVNISVPALPVIPARISGPLDAPVYTVDTAALIRNAAAGILSVPIQAGQGAGALGGQVGREIGRGVRGLLGR